MTTIHLCHFKFRVASKVIYKVAKGGIQIMKAFGDHERESKNGI